MLVTKKMLLALTLVGALVGAGIGALATRSTQSTTAANTNYDTTQPATYSASNNDRTPEQIAATNSEQFKTSEEQAAYRQGFEAGYSACTNSTASSRTVASYQPTYRSSRRYNGARRVYYDYGTAPRGRTFWQKHRDKLTLAMGTGGGALLGGLIGGKKGAGIGSLVGLGGSALYTYKLRHRTRRY
jgi:hypothetical protein